jgi:phospholipase/carboxylesterase
MGKTERRHDPISGLAYRIRPEASADFAVVMLHGLSGDENAMWTLEHALPRGALLVAPRGLYPLGAGTYGWVDPELSGWPRMADFQAAIEALKDFRRTVEQDWNLGPENLFWMGFSQGAALAFSFAALTNSLIKGVIAVAGFLPEGDLSGLRQVPIFWGHGINDIWVPVEHAREGVKKLTEVGGKVSYCEAEVGHKLGIECLRGLKDWMRAIVGNIEPAA